MNISKFFNFFSLSIAAGFVVLSAIIVWMLIPSSSLHIDHACLGAPYLEVRVDQIGRLAFVPFDVGDLIKKGDVLFSLNTEEEKEQQKHWEETVTDLQEKMTYCLAGVEQATQDYFTARSEAEMGIILSEQASALLMILQEQQTIANECKEQLASAKKNLERSVQEMQKKSFCAPFSGVIVKREKTKGDVLQFGEIVYTICDPTTVWVDAVVEEKDIAKVSLNQKAAVRLLVDKKNQWEGVVSWISPTALASQKGVPIRITLQKCDEKVMRPNLSAEVTINVR